MISIIMPYLNEGNEPQLTFNSIKKTADGDFEVIAINDGGMGIVNGAININNVQRLGVGECRNLGVGMASCDNILIIDAHMRFVRGWQKKIENKIKENPHTIFCTRGTPNGWGAYMDIFGDDNIIETKWITRNPHKNEIPVVLGGAFACNKQWFQFLKGYDGMSYWGSNEIYISIKSWMGGGKCEIIPDVFIRHKYRKQFPFKVFREHINYNKLVVPYTLFPIELKRICERYLSEHRNLDKTNKLLSQRIVQLNKLREYYDCFPNSIYKFLEINNEYRRQTFSSVPVL